MKLFVFVLYVQIVSVAIKDSYPIRSPLRPRPKVNGFWAKREKMQVDKGGLNDPEAPEEPPAQVVASLETVLEMDAGFLDAMMKWMEEARVEKAEVLNESSGEAGGTWAGPYSPKY